MSRQFSKKLRLKVTLFFTIRSCKILNVQPALFRKFKKLY